METKTKEKTDVFNVINDRILAFLENGIVPWKKECLELPANLVSGKQYRGVNVLLLSSAGFLRNQFLTFNQIKEMGVKIMEGAVPTRVIYWKRFEGETATNTEPQKLLLRYFNVYNVSQCEMPEDKIPAFISKDIPLKFCEEVLAKLPEKPAIMHRASMPCFLPEYDVINMPLINSYPQPEEYYVDLYRQLIHWTGHEKRLNRLELQDFIKDPVEPFSGEELIAEIGVFLLKSITGIRAIQNDADSHYVMGWTEKLKKDPRLIIYASTKAQKAVDYILNSFPAVKPEQSNGQGK